MGNRKEQLEEMKARELRMFGCEQEQIREMAEKSLSTTMMVLGMMSDAQEQMHMGMMEEARQTLNRAKFVTHLYLRNRDSEREVA